MRQFRHVFLIRPECFIKFLTWLEQDQNFSTHAPILTGWYWQPETPEALLGPRAVSHDRQNRVWNHPLYIFFMSQKLFIDSNELFLR